MFSPHHETNGCRIAVSLNTGDFDLILEVGGNLGCEVKSLPLSSEFLNS